MISVTACASFWPPYRLAGLGQTSSWAFSSSFPPTLCQKATHKPDQCALFDSNVDGQFNPPHNILVQSMANYQIGFSVTV